jgi:hypothetical protein
MFIWSLYASINKLDGLSVISSIVGISPPFILAAKQYKQYTVFHFRQIVNNILILIDLLDKYSIITQRE